MTGDILDTIDGVVREWEIAMSDERDRAAYYEAHRDGPEEWGEPLPAKPRRRLASMISVRLAPEEVSLVREAAERQGVSVSAFLRSAALREARQESARSTAEAEIAALRATGAKSAGGGG